MMGVWFMSSAFAAYAAGMIAGLMAIGEDGSTAESALASLAVYVNVFESLAIAAVVLGLLVLVASPFLQRRM